MAENKVNEKIDRIIIVANVAGAFAKAIFDPAVPHKEKPIPGGIFAKGLWYLSLDEVIVDYEIATRSVTYAPSYRINDPESIMASFVAEHIRIATEMGRKIVVAEQNMAQQASTAQAAEQRNFVE